MTSHRRTIGTWRAIGLAMATMFVEKNPFKRLGLNVPVVVSSMRVTLMLFTAADLHRLWTIPVIGWPDAALAIAIVLAHPLVRALERAKPETTVDLMKALFDRFGVGDVARVAARCARGSREPSKYDDHRHDMRLAC